MNLDDQLKYLDVNLSQDNEDRFASSSLAKAINSLEEFTETNNRFPGLVLDADQELRVLIKNGDVVSIPWSDRMDWARPFINENRRGARPRAYKDLLNFGDLVWIQKEDITGELFLTQIPDVQGSLVSIDPNNALSNIPSGNAEYLNSQNIR